MNDRDARETQHVHIAPVSSSRTSYHLDTDCYAASDSTRAVTRNTAKDMGLSVCKACSGEHTPDGTNKSAAYRAIAPDGDGIEPPEISDNAGAFRHFPMAGECPECGSFETMYVGEELIDEQCCWCGRIIGGGLNYD